jgi:hypothetical protein
MTCAEHAIESLEDARLAYNGINVDRDTAAREAQYFATRALVYATLAVAVNLERET